jgi:hypothetical protein
MDRNRNRKRKANDAASPKAEGSASKRQKTRLVSAHQVVCRSSGLEGRMDEVLLLLLHFPKKHRHGHAARPLPPTATLEKREQTLGLFKTIQTDKLRPKEHETPQTTTTIGLQFIDHLKSAKDKT